MSVVEFLTLVIPLVLGSNVVVAVIVSRREKHKLDGEALDATGGGVQKIVTSSIDLVTQYRAEMELRWSEVRELRKEIGHLEKRLDEEVIKRLEAEAFKVVLEQKAIEQGGLIEGLQKELDEFKNEVLKN